MLFECRLSQLWRRIQQYCKQTVEIDLRLGPRRSDAPYGGTKTLHFIDNIWSNLNEQTSVVIEYSQTMISIAHDSY